MVCPSCITIPQLSSEKKPFDTKKVGERGNFKNKNIPQFRVWSQKYPEKSPGGKALFLISENFNKSPHRYEVDINACGFKISWFQTEKRKKNTAIPRWRWVLTVFKGLGAVLDVADPLVSTADEVPRLLGRAAPHDRTLLVPRDLNVLVLLEVSAAYSWSTTGNDVSLKYVNQQRIQDFSEGTPT